MIGDVGPGSDACSPLATGCAGDLRTAQKAYVREGCYHHPARSAGRPSRAGKRYALRVVGVQPWRQDSREQAVLARDWEVRMLLEAALRLLDTRYRER